ncbi:response regulator [Desulfosarcina ovata]|uniref:DNA-binding response regulator n=2 Tax=Desulfosarcina ovata TaxID=83564 RepID=A0A5K8AMA2_9BACT|nr:response regulator [Desulfosarcina ovata]BBO85709.1 DNA-binding response regulator [Desulfosarcina ovata subsp. sediminis]BBO92754.1 DNA-binding response regulator [Desulfosarcina ovata subsp. ovata]
MADEHILIVEDETKIADLLKDYLLKAGFKVSCLARGDEAVDKVKGLAPALMLLDLMLPGMDGTTVCREVRKFSDIPIIMATAKVDEIDRLIGLEIGADDYICKPFSPREVVARVKAVLRRARPVEAPQRRIAGPMILDENTRQVTVDGHSLNLTPSEFGLLSVLMASPERVFSRAELLDMVQGYRFEGYDRTIDSHVKNLRKKISAHLPDKEVILTIYGVGYKLSV